MELLQKEIEKGQTLFIVVLIMVISLTVGLSVVSKTITNLRTTTEEADSAKALSAAETGVAQQLRSGPEPVAVVGSIQTGTKFNASLTSVSGTNFLVNDGNVISQDEGADVWLVEHDSAGSPVFSSPWTGSLTIYWGDVSGDCNPNSVLPKPALEIITITGSQASPKTTRYAYDPCSRSNNFTSVAQSINTVSGKTFYYNTSVSPISITDGLLVRIIPLYANTILAVTGTAILPQQGSVITSTGQAGNVTRKINVVKGYFTLPSEFFSYGLFVPR